MKELVKVDCENCIFYEQKIKDKDQRIAELEQIIEDSLNQRDKLIKISVRRGEQNEKLQQENTKLQEQLDMFDVPKYRVGDKPFAIIDTMAYTDVRQVTVKNVYTVYEVDDGAFVTL